MSAANSSPKPVELASKFDGGGVEYAAKYLGSCDIADGQSQLLCQEAMQKVFAGLRGRKEPKERLKVTLSMEGIQLKETAAADGKRPALDLSFRHSEVAYVYRELRDQRSWGLVCTEQDPDNAGRKVNKFYAIRTLKSATPLLQDLRQLFQLVKERQEQAVTNVVCATSEGSATPKPEFQAQATEQLPPPSSQPAVPGVAAVAAVPATVVAMPSVVAVVSGAAAPVPGVVAAVPSAVTAWPDSVAAVPVTVAAWPGVVAPAQDAAAAAPGPAAVVPGSVAVAAVAATTVDASKTASTLGVDLLDMSQPEQPVKQPMASSSINSLDDLNELFSSQASLASSGCGGQTSFNPWATQPQLPQYQLQPHQQQQLLVLQQQQAMIRPPSLMLNRQFSQPHSIQDYIKEPARKASHPNMLEPSNVSPAPVYHDNKRPSDPGLLQYSSPHEYYQQQQYLQQQYQQQYQPQYQQPPQPALYGQFQQHPAMYAPYTPVYASGHAGYVLPDQIPPNSPPIPPHTSPLPYQLSPQPVWPTQVPVSSPPPPPPQLLPPTSATPLLDGEFVSVFDQPGPTASAAKTN